MVATSPDTGTVRLRFPSGAAFDAWPAVVVTLAKAAPIPPVLRAEGVPLGRSERTWRVAADDGESVVDAAVRWSAVPGVHSSFPDVVLHHRRAGFDDFNDPRVGGQWYLEKLNMDVLYERSLGAEAVRVAVIDSGISLTHPDLVGAFDLPYDAFSDDDDPSPDPGEFCVGSASGVCDGHGTSVSGIIGARANNGEGIVGLCPECRVVPIKMLGEGAGALSADIAAFEHAIDADAAVINNSWGYTERTAVPEPLADVIARAATETRNGKGSVVIFAAGNDDREIHPEELEALDTILCVSATDRYGNPTAYTNFGDGVDVAAPSATFTTDVNGGYTELFGGTSAAAPVVSGIAGWIVSVAPELTAAEIRSLISETAVPSPKVETDEFGHDPYYGYGELSTAGILDTLFPPEIAEEPRACGCATGADASGWTAGWASIGLAYGLSRFARRGGSKSPNNTDSSTPSVP